MAQRLSPRRASVGTAATGLSRLPRAFALERSLVGSPARGLPFVVEARAGRLDGGWGGGDSCHGKGPKDVRRPAGMGSPRAFVRPR